MHYRIPLELFDIVIDSFTSGPTYNPGLGVRMSKCELGACSLVCRHWARRCRYSIFASVSLRSREDFHALLHLIDTAEEIYDIPPLTECIQEVNVLHSGPWAVPWYHLILKELTAREIELESDCITLELKETYVPEPPGSSDVHYAPRSLSTSLPRTMPRSLFSHAVLSLADLRFKRVRDLLRLIDDQGDLQQITWARISFDAGAILPPARQRTRRPWGDMETIRTSKWSNVDMEMHIMFLIAAEKVPVSMALLPDAWKLMTKAALALVLPCIGEAKLGSRGDGLGVTYNTPSPSTAGTHLLEYHITAPTPRISHPHIFTARLWLRPTLTIEDLKRVDWAAFEDALLSLDPLPDIELVVEHREGADGARVIFGWLLSNILPHNSPERNGVAPSCMILSRAYENGKLDVKMTLTDRWYEWRWCDYLTMKEVLKEADVHEVEGKLIRLSPEEVLKVLFCDSEEERKLVLEESAQARQSVAEGERCEQEGH